MADVLPSSVPRKHSTVFIGGVAYVRIACANCGKPGGAVPEPMVASGGFVCYLCDGCAERWSPLVGTMLMPDEVFWARAREVQLEVAGREMTPAEILRALEDPSHPLSKLARDRAALTPKE